MSFDLTLLSGSGLLIAGLLSGIISGMGIGGGTILIPTLAFLYAIEQQAAQGVNLVFFLPTAVIALYLHNKNHRVEWGIAKKISVCGVLGAIAGSFIALSLEPDVLRKVFGGFLLLMGVKEIFAHKKVG
ncbi:MAG: sulfite exporter TauE/SafE family protein [Bacillota bacterium]